jgi:hypothetical protein
VTPYVIDSSGWIELWRKYPPAVFPLLWKKLRELCDAGELICPDIVLTELQDYLGDPVLPKLLSTWTGLFQTPSTEVQAKVTPITTKYVGLVNVSGTKGGGDPFVVAMGVIEGGTVVTMEKRRKNPSDAAKIPDACDGEGVEVVDVLGLIPKLGLAL